MLHLVVGPGKLALGLLVPSSKAAGFDVCLVGRSQPAQRERRRYALDIDGVTQGQEFRRVEYACNPDGVEDLDDDIRRRLAGREPLLITTSLDGKIVARVDFLVAVCRLRPPEAETVLVICENAPDAGYEELRRQLPPYVAVCESVVDRLCSAPDPPRTRTGHRIVVAHPVAEWVIAHPAPEASAVIGALCAGSSDVHAVVELAPYEARKLWTVNGLHLGLALAARAWDLDHLDPSGEPTRSLADHALGDAFQAAAKHQIDALEQILALEQPELPPLRDYATRRVRVFCEVRDDTTKRILEKGLVRADLRPLVDRLEQRVAEPARAAARHGIDTRPFRAVVLAFLELVGRHDAFYAAKAAADGSSPPEPSHEVDALVVAAFRAMCEDWLDPFDAERYARRLERALLAWYDG